MKKAAIFSISTLVSVVSFAQTTYYVEPTIQLKYSDRMAEQITQSNDHLRIYNADCPRWSGPLFGVNLGASLNEGRQNIVLGVNSDRAVFDYGYGVYDPSIGTAQGSINTVKVNYTNLRLTFEQRLLTPGNSNLYVLVGVGGTFNNRNQQKNIKNPNVPTQFDRSSPVQVSDEVYRTARNKTLFSPTLTFGLKSDFYTKKGNYLFSSAAMLAVGLTDVATMDIHTQTNINNNTSSGLTKITSQGTGIYLQLSRKLNFRSAK